MQLKKEMWALEQQEQAEQQGSENKSAKSQAEDGNNGAMKQSEEGLANENTSDSTSEGN